MTVPVPIPKLWQLAELHCITVLWYPDELYPRGTYCETIGGPFIFLNPFLKRVSMRYRCTFAHELGHFFSGVEIGWTDVNKGRDDERAMRWAYEVVLPEWWLRRRLNWEPWRIAEEADVYQEWVEAKLRLLRNDMEKEKRRRKAVSSS